MKIGIYNIYTTFWFLLIISCGGMLTYISIEKNLLTSDLIFIAKFFVGLLSLISIGIFCFLLFRFRFLIINAENVVSIRPFIFKKKVIDLKHNFRIKIEQDIDQKAAIYRRIKLSDANSTLEFTDKEFENFESLVRQLPLKDSKKKAIDLAQAKANISQTNFDFYLYSGGFLFIIANIIWNSGFHYMVLIFFGIDALLLFAAIRRKLRYDRILKN
ncbi:hypothetical protein [Kordia sp.]|uniref:hypothetical protein n=1 Tax=Kordia sp. TaxID=1965332 RepID=UPI003D293FD3